MERKIEATNLLANMLGFTRHERLDVKKPGPPAGPPPSSQSPHEAPTAKAVIDVNKEVVPSHIKGTLYLFLFYLAVQFIDKLNYRWFIA